MLAYFYQYAVGTLIFAAGLWAGWRQGYVGTSGRGLRHLLILVGGLVAFALVQAHLQFAEMSEAPAGAFDGAWTRKKRLGEPIDYAVMIGYFVAILIIGTWFGRRQRSVRDFFFGGARFSWWLIAFSFVATVVGSYSFVKYSRVGFEYGVSSSQTYMNDWFWMPLFWFSWLPILYFSRVSSIPEYFERRFGPTVRGAVTTIMLIYLVGYVGVNLYTMGAALESLLGWGIWPSAILVATISAIYVTAGGQTSVIMTDLFQGVMLVATGLLVLGLGMWELGGPTAFWEHLPRGHRTAFASFSEDPAFNSVGIFWQDGVANTAMFYFLNQGVIMRFLSARDVQQGRKAMLWVPLLLMPLAAVVVASGGWVGKALEHAGVLPTGLPARDVFFIAAEYLSRPGIFGLILAALTAALMSTVDTLITAVAAIAVNDVYKPYVNPKAGERELLKVARWTSVIVTLVGVLLVPLYMSFKSIYAAHGAFTAAITPPLVVTFFLSFFWRRFTTKAAVATLLGGLAVIVASLFWPAMIAPFGHGTPYLDNAFDPLLGADQFKYIRAFFGLFASAVIGVGVSLLTENEPREQTAGLVFGTVKEALARFRGREGDEFARAEAQAAIRAAASDLGAGGPQELPNARLGAGLAAALRAAPGDMIWISDARAWLGGLRSTHAHVLEVIEGEGMVVEVASDPFETVVARGREARAVVVERLY